MNKYGSPTCDLMNDSGAFEQLFLPTPAADAWAARATQPLAAMTRPTEVVETQVPLVEMGACDDLDLIARELAATDDGSDDLLSARRRRS